MGTKRQAKLRKHRLLVVLESPFAGKDKNEKLAHLAYTKKALLDSISRGESPIAGHLLYTQEGILNDDIPSERTKGMECHLSWIKAAEVLAVYTDMGISDGMGMAVRMARRQGVTIEYRSIA